LLACLLRVRTRRLLNSQLTLPHPDSKLLEYMSFCQSSLNYFGVSLVAVSNILLGFPLKFYIKRVSFLTFKFRSLVCAIFKI